MTTALYRMFQQAVTKLNYETAAGAHLYEVARASVGKEMSPLDKAPDDLACVESWEQVIYKAFNEGTGSGLSTIRAKVVLDNSRKFVKVRSPKKGDTILSPTQGKNIGHIGLVGSGETEMCDTSIPIYSNNSNTSFWNKHQTLEGWKNYYKEEKKLPIYFYRRIVY